DRGRWRHEPLSRVSFVRMIPDWRTPALGWSRFVRADGARSLSDLVGLGEIVGRIDQGNAGKCLWKVPEHLLLARIILLSQQAEIVAKPEKLLEQAARIFLPPDQQEGVRQP